MLELSGYAVTAFYEGTWGNDARHAFPAPTESQCCEEACSAI